MCEGFIVLWEEIDCFARSSTFGLGRVTWGYGKVIGF